MGAPLGPGPPLLLPEDKEGEGMECRWPAAAAAGRGGKEMGARATGRPPLLSEDEEGDRMGCRCRWPAAAAAGRGGKMRRGRRWDLDEMGRTGSRDNGVGRRRFGANGIG